MQKKLLTLAVAGALAGPGLALAQSSVEVYGTVYPTFGNVKYGDGFTQRNIDIRTGAVGTGSSTPQGVPAMSKLDVQAPSSNFGVRGREGLGGGLTAWFQIEQNAPLEREATQAVTVASRNSAAGIQGAFGNLFVGQWTTPWADMDSLWAVGQVSVFGPVTSLIGRRETTGTAPNQGATATTTTSTTGTTTGAAPGATVVPGVGAGAANAQSCTTNLIPPGGTGAPNANGVPQCDAVVGGGGVGHPFWRRASDMIRYTSPTFGGATFDLMYQIPELKSVTLANGAGVTANPSMFSTSVKWSGMGGRARVGLAIDRHKDFTTIGKTDNGWAIKGGFNFGVADVGVAFEHMGYQCGTQPLVNQNTGTGAAAPVGGTTIPGFSAASSSNLANRPTLCAASDGTVTAKQWAIGVSVPVGIGALKASYAKAADMTGAIAFGETGAKEWLFGYEHRFSKRTSLGVEYAKITNNRNANFTWTGMPPVQNQTGASNTPFFGSSVGWLFASMTHRF
jgi:predicted porin